jgi:hypothetical protein
MRLAAFTFFMLIGQTARYLARVKHLPRSGTRHPFLGGLLFSLLSYMAPSICVTESDVANPELDQKITKYAERCKMATLYLY